MSKGLRRSKTGRAKKEEGNPRHKSNGNKRVSSALALNLRLAKLFTGNCPCSFERIRRRRYVTLSRISAHAIFICQMQLRCTKLTREFYNPLWMESVQGLKATPQQEEEKEDDEDASSSHSNWTISFDGISWALRQTDTDRQRR